MASWCEVNGFAGVAQWMYTQAEEEKLHMLKFIKYINERGGKAILPAFKKPPTEFKSVEEMFKEVLKHEQFVTASINEIVDLTLSEKDFNTHNFVQWFVMEQVQEESAAQAIIDKLRLVGKNNLYQFDRDIMSLRAPEAGTPAAQ